MTMTEPIRRKEHIRMLSEHYLKEGSLRNHTLIILGLYTALRISDLLRLQWDDVFDFDTGSVRSHISLEERKTGKCKVIALNPAAVKALTMLSSGNASKNCAVIANPRTGKAISRVQAYRIIRNAAEALAIGRVSCHSLRKTFGYHAWKDGAPLPVVMEIYNHNSFAVTRRYLGVSQDDKDGVYMDLNLSE